MRGGLGGGGDGMFWIRSRGMHQALRHVGGIITSYGYRVLKSGPFAGLNHSGSLRHAAIMQRSFLLLGSYHDVFFSELIAYNPLASARGELMREREFLGVGISSPR